MDQLLRPMELMIHLTGPIQSHLLHRLLKLNRSGQSSTPRPRSNVQKLLRDLPGLQQQSMRSDFCIIPELVRWFRPRSRKRVRSVGVKDCLHVSFGEDLSSLRALGLPRFREVICYLTIEKHWFHKDNPIPTTCNDID